MVDECLQHVNQPISNCEVAVGDFVHCCEWLASEQNMSSVPIVWVSKCWFILLLMFTGYCSALFCLCNVH